MAIYGYVYVCIYMAMYIYVYIYGYFCIKGQKQEFSAIFAFTFTQDAQALRRHVGKMLLLIW